MEILRQLVVHMIEGYLSERTFAFIGKIIFTQPVILWLVFFCFLLHEILCVLEYTRKNKYEHLSFKQRHKNVPRLIIVQTGHAAKYVGQF